MAGLEYDLWEMIINPTRQFVTAAVPIEKLEELAEIANDIGGWIVWDDEFGETFIPMDEWLKRYERFKTYGPTPEEL